jgi:hypothetical protein
MGSCYLRWARGVVNSETWSAATFAGLGSARVYAYWFQRRAETVSSAGAIKMCAYSLEKVRDRGTRSPARELRALR